MAKGTGWKDTALYRAATDWFVSGVTNETFLEQRAEHTNDG